MRPRRIIAASEGQNRARPSRLLVVLVVLVVFVLGASVLSPAAAPAVTQKQGAKNKAVGPSSTTALVLAGQTPWVSRDDEFVLRIRPVTAADPADLELSIAVYSPVRSRSQFIRTLDGKMSGRPGRVIPVPLASLLPASESLAVTVRLRPSELRISTPGVYPLSVALREQGGRVLGRLITHLVLVSDHAEGQKGQKLGLSWVIRVHAPPSSIPGSDLQAMPVKPVADLARALGAANYRDVPVVLAPTPEVLETLEAGDQASRSAVAALADVLGGRQIVRRPYVTVDAARLIDSNLDRHLDTQLERGTKVVSELLGRTPDDSTWLVDHALDSQTLSELESRQVERFVIPEAYLTPVSLPVTLAQPFLLEPKSGRRQLAVMADTGLASHFRNGGDQVLAAHHLLADLAVLWGDAPGRERAVVTLPPPSWRPTRAFLEAVLGGLVTSPLIEPMSLDTLFAQVEPARTPRGTRLVRTFEFEPRPALGVPTASLNQARDWLDALGSVLVADSPTYERLERQLLVTEAAGLQPSVRRSYLEGLDEAFDRWQSILQVARSRTFTIPARAGEIPLAIVNRSNETVTVNVRVESDSLAFPGGFTGGTEKIARLRPRSNTLTFPVRAPAPGTFRLRVTLSSPSGDLVLAKTNSLAVRSTAFSGLGLVLSIGAALFLLAWWSRQLARDRRSRHPSTRLLSHRPSA